MNRDGWKKRAQVNEFEPRSANSFGVPAEMAQQKFSQDNGIVLFRVVRAVDQRKRTLAERFVERLQCLSMGPQFRAITNLKFLPSRLRFVMKPVAQGISRSNVLKPSIKSRDRAFHSARPQAINQNACAVGARRGFIGPFYLDFRLHCLLFPRTDSGMRRLDTPLSPFCL